MGLAKGSWLPAAAALLGACATTTPGGQPAGIGGSGAPAQIAPPRGPALPAPAQQSMEIQAEHGSLDREDVADAIDPHFPRLSRCYEDAEPTTDFASGQVTLRFVVGLDGTTASVHVRSSDLGSWEVERCLVTVASRIRFARPQGYGVASFEYSLEFRSTGAIPVVQLEPDALTGQLPAIGHRLLEDCGGLGINELRATLYVDRRGRVRSVGFGTPGPLDAERAACLVRSISREALTVAVHGASLGRVAISLRPEDAVAVRPPASPARPEPRSIYGRRRPRR
jgi:hypothetical protein